MDSELETMRVADYVFAGVRLEATCQGCGRRRVIYGGVLPRNFTPETRIKPPMLEAFAQRFVCGNCGTRGPVLRLGRFD
jgi:hypothetical protein